MRKMPVTAAQSCAEVLLCPCRSSEPSQARRTVVCMDRTRQATGCSRTSLGSVMSTTSKERLQEILLSLTEPEAEIVWEAYSSRPSEEDRGDALGRGLGDVYERRRARAPDSGRDAPC